MDIRRMKVWLLGSDEPLPFDPRESQPDCLCLPVAGERDLAGRVADEEEASEQLELDLDTVIDLDGEQVTLKELREGNLRQSDFTQKNIF